MKNIKKYTIRPVFQSILEYIIQRASSKQKFSYSTLKTEGCGRNEESMGKYTQASVSFETADASLARLYGEAERKCRGNLKDFGGRRVLIEGGGYNKIWLETQPMGGEMYAFRDIEAAMNNTLLFMDHQRGDGRLPGSIAYEDGRLIPQFNKIQGFCLPWHALNLYYITGRDRAYLQSLYDCLAAFDAYLWRTRDSDGDGCLESWCVTDTGEDGALRYADAPFWWTEERPPEGYAVVPIASMDFMGYSCAARDTLAEASRLLGDGREEYWRGKAEAVRERVKAYLWDEGRGACFDRDKHGSVMPALLHNNLRLMYYGGMSRGMADRFIREHLLNPDEFWTRVPLPSVAINDPTFRNIPGNNWSGQPQGLTYQRAILALERYGYAELLPRLAERFYAAIGPECVFTQQFDPFASNAEGTHTSGCTDGYGPTMLAALGYVEHTRGIHVCHDALYWSAFGAGEYEYTLQWDGKTYTLESDGRMARGYVNGKHIFTCKAGGRVATDSVGTSLRSSQ